MAYTSVIPVRRLDRAVKYVMNKEKTTAVSLQDALDYAANRDKTEQSCFESSYACTLETAFADMRQTKERWHKSGGVQGYHLVQSFAVGEVTPELAHQIAKELTDRVLGGRYEYVIGTHLNTGHIHSHIVWNTVSCVDGKKYRSNYKSYVTEIRAVSDELCRKYKLSVIDTENSNHVAKPYAEWLAEKNGQPTWRTAIRQDVDEAVQQSLTWRQFLSAMERKGYEVHMGRKYPVLRPPEKERFVRFKTLGKRYTPEAIQTRILYPRSYRPYVENPPTIQRARLRDNSKPRRKLTGLRALYYRYLYELGALPRKPRRPSYAVRQDAYKLDQRIRQMEFLSKNNIDTLAQLIYAQNFSMPAGYVKDSSNKSWLLKVGEEYDSVSDIEGALLLHVDGFGDVRLSDVADVAVIDNAEASYTRLNGERAVVLKIFRNATSSAPAASRTAA